MTKQKGIQNKEVGGDSMEVQEKMKQFNKQIYVEFVNRILEADFDELIEIGKELLEFTNDPYKKLILSLYKQRKYELLSEELKNDTIFSTVYKLIQKADMNIIGTLGRLVYHLREFLPKNLVSYLFDAYNKKKEELARIKEKVETEEEEDLNDDIIDELETDNDIPF